MWSVLKIRRPRGPQAVYPIACAFRGMRETRARLAQCVQKARTNMLARVCVRLALVILHRTWVLVILRIANVSRRTQDPQGGRVQSAQLEHTMHELEARVWRVPQERISQLQVSLKLLRAWSVGRANTITKPASLLWMSVHRVPHTHTAHWAALM